MRNISLFAIVIATVYMFMTAMFGELGLLFGTVFNVGWLVLGGLFVCLNKNSKNI